MLKEVPLDKKLYLFELDDVLYPKSDYLLQIYYLFGQFVEFNESRAIGSQVTQFMKDTYLSKGEEAVFAAVQKEFEFQQDYKENFERLHVNAQLPLKLLLPTQIKLLFASILERGAKIGVLTAGNPAMQLNKLKHIDWQGFDREFKVYFIDELIFRNFEPINYIASENNIGNDDIFFIQAV